MFNKNNNTTAANHTSRDTALGAGVGGILGHKGHKGHTARDAAIGAFGGHELGHHGNGTAPGTHGNRDGLLGAGAGAAIGHGSGHGMRDAAIGGIGGEMLGRHQGKHAHNRAPVVAPVGPIGATGAGAVTNSAPSKTHGKMKEVEGKVERGLGNVVGSASLEIKGENKIIAGQREQAAVTGHRQADMLEAQAANHRNRADALHPTGGRY
ncbi:hypothetical protein BDP27DRAFT_1256981 [Rhodocollybia butyracea]|uniref:Uncharacterized protein n=1 Tax=Rhodocollybia butyracea TaxID=206335 RepID=A0A9P5UD94_9AGAR|nr:hypothetical protein BDP27DRAFT_1256981 [Rhodocollybia butyracea]